MRPRRRWPKQTDRFNKLFYQRNYIKLGSDNVILPPDEELKVLLENNFEGHHRKLGQRLEAVQTRNEGGRLVVFGANWGYEVFQFRKAGYEAMGFEVSQPRADYARDRLECPVFHEREKVLGEKPFDIFYSSHTFEHLPDPSIGFSFAEEALAPGGWAVILVPNCGGKDAREQGLGWGPFSSSFHPMSYTADFFKAALPRHGFENILIYTRPYDIEQINRREPNGNEDGEELLVFAQRKG
ncbi:MAG: class I SAM-dependent methyltransferase [Verrucomicrobiota bacterium]